MNPLSISHLELLGYWWSIKILFFSRKIFKDYFDVHSCWCRGQIFVCMTIVSGYSRSGSVAWVFYFQYYTYSPKHCQRQQQHRVQAGWGPSSLCPRLPQWSLADWKCQNSCFQRGSSSPLQAVFFSLTFVFLFKTVQFYGEECFICPKVHEMHKCFWCLKLYNVNTRYSSS